MTGICKLNFDLLVYTKLGIINTGTVKRTFERDTGCLNNLVNTNCHLSNRYMKIQILSRYLMSKAKCRILQRKRLFDFNDR